MFNFNTEKFYILTMNLLCLIFKFILIIFNINFSRILRKFRRDFSTSFRSSKRFCVVREIQNNSPANITEHIGDVHKVSEHSENVVESSEIN